VTRSLLKKAQDGAIAKAGSSSSKRGSNNNNSKPSRKNKKSKKKPQRWLVEFFTTWSPPCKTLAPLFAELSIEYGTERFRFGKVNVDSCPKLAERFHISREATRWVLVWVGV
jgi:thioredoxin-like negative regulator of GroEL